MGESYQIKDQEMPYFPLVISRPLLTMKVFQIILVLTFANSVFGQSTVNGLIGIYESRDNAFERFSSMILSEQNRFTYKYGAGGCQGEVTGTWKVENQQLIFENDPQFLNNGIIFYPDLSLTSWKIKRIGIQPNDDVNTGCLKETGLHIKNTVIPSYDYTVSIVQLICNPEKYHNRRIQVVGYLNLEFEGDAIYLHKEDYKQSILENSLWVSFDNKITAEQLKKLNKGYVLIAGTYDMEQHGHMGIFSGEIRNIDRIIKWGK